MAVLVSEGGISSVSVMVTVEETYVNLKQYQVIRSADEARLQNSKHKKSVNRRSENSTNKRADLTRNHPLSL